MTTRFLKQSGAGDIYDGSLLFPATILATLLQLNHPKTRMLCSSLPSLQPTKPAVISVNLLPHSYRHWSSKYIPTEHLCYVVNRIDRGPTLRKLAF